MEENKVNLSALSDRELLDYARKMKTTAVIKAFIIGILIGIVIYSIFFKTLGLLMLIPLYFAHRLANKPGYDKRELEVLLRERNLK